MKIERRPIPQPESEIVITLTIEEASLLRLLASKNVSIPASLRGDASEAIFNPIPWAADAVYQLQNDLSHKLGTIGVKSTTREEL